MVFCIYKHHTRGLMKFSYILEMYNSGMITNKEYGMRMFEKYEELLDYKKLLKNSKVKKISINDDDVVFSIINKDCRGKEYTIDMILYEQDAAAVPATELSFASGYESDELKFVSQLCSYLEKNSIVFDIGANLGWFSLCICVSMPDATCYAFEPIKQTYNKLNKNLQINNVINCNTFNLGISDQNCDVTFFYDVEASGASSMKNLREADSTKLENCKVERLDDFVKKQKLDRIDFIKCDVEGAELFVYQGGIESIRKYKPIVYSEMLRKWSAKFNYHPNDIINLYDKLDYGCFVLSSIGGLSQISKVDNDTIETNYFFMHMEKHKEIINHFCSLK